MSNQNEVLKSAKDIVSNMEDLVNDIANLDEHEHDENECSDCETVYESGKENHDHDVWDCADCESMLDESVSDRISNLDVNDLMDQNYDLWQTVGEEAVVEYQERTGEVSAALDELVQRVLGLYSTLENTDVDDVTEAINYITEKVYGVREEYKPIVPQEDIIEIALNIGADAPKDSLTLDNKKCSCGIDHSATNYGQI
jgi:hypothetical protein